MAGFLFSSPILSYYGVSTLSDIQSFSLSIVGFYYFYRFLKEHTTLSFLLFILLFSLAGLIKASAALTFTLCIMIFFLNGFSWKKPLDLVKNDWKKILLMVIPPFIWYSWYSYVTAYNNANNQGAFLVGILPIWDLSSQQIAEIFSLFVFNTLPEVFQPALFWFLLLVLVPLAVSKAKVSLNRIAILMAFVLFLFFVVCFFGAMNVHDYYLLNPFVLIVIALFFALKEWNHEILIENYRPFVIILSALTLVFTYLSGMKTWLKINDNVQDINNVIVFNEYERKNLFWMYWQDREMYKVFENNKINVDSIGIRSQDLVFCLGDVTINRVLYFLNRRGYSNYNVTLENTPAFLRSYNKIKFLVLIDPNLKSKPNLQEFYKNKIYEKESLSIYRIN